MIGIELKNWSPNGNDGSVNGQIYFQCAPGHGYFVELHHVIDFSNDEQQADEEEKVENEIDVQRAVLKLVGVKSTSLKPVVATVEPEDAKDSIDLTEFHPKIQQLFRGKENRLRMIDEWVLMETLAVNNYSKTKLGLQSKTGQKAALKMLFADASGKISQSKKKQLMRELNVMKKVNHPNVIKLITFNAEAKYPESVK